MSALSMLPEEILQRIKTEAAKAKFVANPKNWRPPQSADFKKGCDVLCFDQSLNNCGWALLSTSGSSLEVTDSGTIRPPTISSKGFEGTLTKAILLSRELRALMEELQDRYGAVAVELPSFIGYRTESSLVAAVTICVELDRLGKPFPDLVSRTSSAALLCGDRAASKKVSGETVDDLIDFHPTGPGCWTEHVRDAVLVGLRSIHVG